MLDNLQHDSENQGWVLKPNRGWVGVKQRQRINGAAFRASTGKNASLTPPTIQMPRKCGRSAPFVSRGDCAHVALRFFSSAKQCKENRFRTLPFKRRIWKRLLIMGVAVEKIIQASGNSPVQKCDTDDSLPFDIYPNTYQCGAWKWKRPNCRRHKNEYKQRTFVTNHHQSLYHDSLVQGMSLYLPAQFGFYNASSSSPNSGIWYSSELVVTRP